MHVARDLALPLTRGNQGRLFMQVRVRVFAILVLTIAALSARISYADDCTTTLAPLFNAGGAHIKLSITTVDTRWVSYTDGFIRSTGYWITGTLSQLFSDREKRDPGMFTGQPFDIGAADQHTPYIGPNGEVWIYNNTWGFWSHFYGACSNGFLYGFVDGGMFSIAATPYTPPPPPR
jgi:hypothetical protein